MEERREAKRELVALQTLLRSTGLTDKQRGAIVAAKSHLQVRLETQAQHDQEELAIRRKFVQDNRGLLDVCDAFCTMLEHETNKEGFLTKGGYMKLQRGMQIALLGAVPFDPVDKGDKKAVDVEWNCEKLLRGDLDRQHCQDIFFEIIETWTELLDRSHLSAFPAALLDALGDLSSTSREPALRPHLEIPCILHLIDQGAALAAFAEGRKIQGVLGITPDCLGRVRGVQEMLAARPKASSSPLVSSLADYKDSDQAADLQGGLDGSQGGTQGDISSHIPPVLQMRLLLVQNAKAASFLFFILTHTEARMRLNGNYDMTATGEITGTITDTDTDTADTGSGSAKGSTVRSIKVTISDGGSVKVGSLKVGSVRMRLGASGENDSPRAGGARRDDGDSRKDRSESRKSRGSRDSLDSRDGRDSSADSDRGSGDSSREGSTRYSANSPTPEEALRAEAAKEQQAHAREREHAQEALEHAHAQAALALSQHPQRPDEIHIASTKPIKSPQQIQQDFRKARFSEFAASGKRLQSFARAFVHAHGSSGLNTDHITGRSDTIHGLLSTAEVHEAVLEATAQPRQTQAQAQPRRSTFHKLVVDMGYGVEGDSHSPKTGLESGLGSSVNGDFDLELSGKSCKRGLKGKIAPLSPAKEGQMDVGGGGDAGADGGSGRGRGWEVGRGECA
ncbi:hypothetical protein B484DRAFT_103280 [Ochromonadaceae sp. CCMP2298]|nr:hypothetical protein B484DRAFT_103280 [Ochromonadaceae sp. CCMP2298]